MNHIFSTDDVPEPDRFSYWLDEFVAASGVQVGMKEPPHPFRSTLDVFALGDALIARQEASAYAATHGPREIARSSVDPVLVVLKIAGEFQFRHDGTMSRASGGDVLVFDTTHPWHCEIPQGNHACLWMQLQRNTLSPLLVNPHLPAISRFGNGSPMGRLLGGYLRSLAAGNSEIPDGTGQAVVENFAGLVAIALGASEETRHTTGRTGLRAARLCSIQAYANQRLNDLALSPSAVAGHFNITPRYLHKLFEETGVSFSRWVQVQRLKQCYDELVNPANGERRIAEIAYRWGFNDQAHFGRCFRNQFGITPGEARAVGLRLRLPATAQRPGTDHG